MKHCDPMRFRRRFARSWKIRRQITPDLRKARDRIHTWFGATSKDDASCREVAIKHKRMDWRYFDLFEK